MRRSGSLVLSLLVCWIAAAGVSGQVSSRDDNTFVIPVSVTSRSDLPEYVTGLDAGDLEVSYKKQKLEIVEILPNDGPWGVGVIIDNSGSMYDSKDRVLESLDGLSEIFSMEMFEGSRFLLANFRGNENEFVEITGSTNGVSLRGFVDDDADGNTALFDVAKRMIEDLGSLGFERKILFILSDGEDNLSKARYREVISLAVSQNVLVYPFLVVRDRFQPLGMSGETFLARIAKVSGGKMLSLSKKFSSEEVATVLGDELRHLYFVRVRSNVRTNDPERRSLSVKLSKEAKERLGKVKIYAEKQIIF